MWISSGSTAGVIPLGLYEDYSEKDARKVEEGPDNRQGGWISRRMVMAMVLVAIVATGVVLTASALGVFKRLSCALNPSISTGQVHFTIVMSGQGFNDSMTHYPVPWPILNVAACQTVSIHVVNQDTRDAHGFAITHYFTSGVILSPGQTHDVVFTASQTGTFLVYCTIICPIHVYMLDGKLNVS
jgi:hypothetical protein